MKLTEKENIITVVERADGMFIVEHGEAYPTIVPEDIENKHYTFIQEWAAIEGNNITPYEE